MKVSLIVFSALFAIAGPASADWMDGVSNGAGDAKKSVPGIGETTFSPSVTEKITQDPGISSSTGWGTGKGDAKRKYIGETEKNLHKVPPPTATPINLPKPPENPATPPGVPVPYPNTGAPRPGPPMK